jgi:hypothetical protein
MLPSIVHLSYVAEALKLFVISEEQRALCGVVVFEFVWYLVSQFS